MINESQCHYEKIIYKHNHDVELLAIILTASAPSISINFEINGCSHQCNNCHENNSLNEQFCHDWTCQLVSNQLLSFSSSWEIWEWSTFWKLCFGVSYSPLFIGTLDVAICVWESLDLWFTDYCLQDRITTSWKLCRQFNKHNVINRYPIWRWKLMSV